MFLEISMQTDVCALVPIVVASEQSKVRNELLMSQPCTL